MFVVILILSSFQFLIGILPLSWMLLRGARWTVLWNSHLHLQPALGDRQWQGSVPVVLPARPALPWETCRWFHACLLCRAVHSVLKRVPAVLGVTMRVSEGGNGVDLFPVLAAGLSSCGADSGRWWARPCCPVQEASRGFLSRHRWDQPSLQRGSRELISMGLPGGVLSPISSLLYFVLELFLVWYPCI